MDRLEVDGSRPAVALVADLPRSYRLTDAEWRVLMVLACDSYDGRTSAPGVENIATWSGLWRSSAAAAIARLLDPTEHRPALLAHAEKSRGGPGRRTVYELRLPVDDAPNRPVTPDGSTVHEPSGQPSTNRPATPDGQPSGEPSGHAGLSLSLDLSLPQPQARDDGLRAGHQHHGNAERALEGLIQDKQLPLPHSELMTHAYRLGNGDPWKGYLEIKRLSEKSLVGANSPAAVLRSRLAAAPASTTPTSPWDRQYVTGPAEPRANTRDQWLTR